MSDPFRDFLPDVDLGGTVELDIGKTALSVSADIGIETDKDHKDADRAAFMERYTPRFIRYPLGGNAPAGGVAVYPVSDDPSIGRRLEVHRFYLDIAIPIVGTGIATKPTTVSAFLCVATPAQVSALSSFNVLTSSVNTSPVDKGWGTRQVIVVPPENLYLVLANSGASDIQMSGYVQCTNLAFDQWDIPENSHDLRHQHSFRTHRD